MLGQRLDRGRLELPGVRRRCWVARKPRSSAGRSSDAACGASRCARLGREPIPEAQHVPLVELLEARPQRADVGNGGVYARHLAPPDSQSGSL